MESFVNVPYDVRYPFVVGHRYKIPTVGDTPIIGTPHSDTGYLVEVGQHYHIDNRFTQFVERTRVCYPGPVEMKVHYCWRAELVPVMLPSFLMALTLAFNERKLACRLCPHRGMPVINGVCSGHSLQWKADGSIKWKAPYRLTLECDGEEYGSSEPLTEWNGKLAVQISRRLHYANTKVALKDSNGETVAKFDHFVSTAAPGDVITFK